MTDLAPLGLVIYSEQAEIAEERLDGMAQAADRAENATDSLASAARRAGGATAAMNTGIRQQERVLGATRGAMGLTAAEGLNLSRQFTDIGVTAAMGMNPLMIAIQQGPQIMDTFGMAAQRTGTTIKAVMLQVGAAIWTAMAPLLPIIAAIGIAVGALAASWGLASRSITLGIGDVTKEMNLTEDQLKRLEEKNTVTTATMGDAWNGLGTTIKEMFQSVFGDQLSWVDSQWNSFLDDLTANTGKEVDAIAGFFVGSYRAIIATWQNFPAVFSDIIAMAANAGGAIMNDLVKNSVNELNFLIRAANSWALVTGNRSRIPEIGAPGAAFRTSRQTTGAAANVAGAYSEGYASQRGMSGRAMDTWRQNTRDSTIARVGADAGEAGDGDSDRAVRAAREVREVMDRVERVNLKPLNAFVEMLNPLKLVADELRLIDGLAQDAARGMASAFGDAGRAMGDLLTTMTGYQSRLAEINLAESEHRINATQAERERASAQVQNYGDMLGAAKGFFKEGSDGYQALQAAEQAYRLFQFAMMVQSMVMGGQETAATVGQNVIKAASHGVVAVARALASLPFPFNLAAGAATLAALVAIGVKLTGGGGGGGGSRGTYNPAPINSRDESIATARGQASAANAGGGALTERLAQQIKVKIELNDPMFRARVQSEAAPMVRAGSEVSVATSRKAVPADRSRADMFTMGGRGR